MVRTTAVFWAVVVCATFTVALANDGQCESGKCRDESSISRMRKTVVEMLDAQTAGDAAKYISKLAPGVKTLFNGQAVPWNDKEAIEVRFGIVTNSAVKFLQPITKIDDNNVIVTIQWSIRIKATFEDFSFFGWNQKITFNAAGLIEKLDVITDSLPLRYLANALEPTTYDKKAIIDSYLATFATRDVTGVKTYVSENLIMKRNGQPDIVQWQDPNFLNILHRRSIKVEAVSTLYAEAGSRAAQVHITWTFTMSASPGDPITFRDAWYVVFPPAAVQPARIAVIHSVVDMPGLMQVYQPMEKDIQALQKQFQENQQKAAAPGSTGSGAGWV